MTDICQTHLIDCLPVGIIATGPDGTVRVINPYAESLLGAADLAGGGPSIDALFGRQGTVPPESLCRPGCAATMGARRIRHNGRILELTGAPWKGDKGAPLGTVFVLTDVTETQRRQDQEKKSEKYAAMGEISADIAHEIRNPLGSIELFASLLKKELTRKKDISRVNQIIAAAKNVEHKIQELILSSQTCQAPVSCVNVHDILKDIMLFSERIIDQESAFLSVSYADVQPIVECNADLIKQVFLNLILKSLQTIQEAGRLDIVTRHLPESRTIEIHFIDSSPQVRDANRTKGLDSSARLKEINSGLDLAIVHNIVNMYQGAIRIELVENSGIAFIISFPLADVDAAGAGRCGPENQRT
jgi:signal transduction histidine kinase